MDERGLDHDGTIAREGGLDRVRAAFASVVDAARAHITETFGNARLHSAYLYGSIPRGSATPGFSDLDLLLALHDEPTEADRADAAIIEAALDRAFPQIDGASIQLSSTRTLLSDLERHDGGFFVACLCTPLLGDDLADYPDIAPLPCSPARRTATSPSCSRAGAPEPQKPSRTANARPSAASLPAASSAQGSP
jgi:predicted nucleotidyltransferase